MINYTKVVIDGNDGTGKTVRANELRKLIKTDPETNGKVVVEERGILSKATDNECLFDIENKWERKYALENLAKELSDDATTIYVIFDSPVIECQKRILNRGDRLDKPYHNFIDLCIYREKFKQLYYDLMMLNVPNIIMTATCTSIQDPTSLKGAFIDAMYMFKKIKS